MQADVLNMPLGHPGCAIPKTWQGATSVDGKSWIGTSLHEPATKANCDALRQIEALGARRVFLDDDFRLTASPGGIGGCFCPDHKQAFLRHTGHAEPKWQELRDDVVHRKLTPVLRDWVLFQLRPIDGSAFARNRRPFPVSNSASWSCIWGPKKPAFD